MPLLFRRQRQHQHQHENQNIAAAPNPNNTRNSNNRQQTGNHLCKISLFFTLIIISISFLYVLYCLHNNISEAWNRGVMVGGKQQQEKMDSGMEGTHTSTSLSCHILEAILSGAEGNIYSNANDGTSSVDESYLNLDLETLLKRASNVSDVLRRQQLREYEDDTDEPSSTARQNQEQSHTNQQQLPYQMDSIFRWNQYIGLWRYRNHFRNVSKVMGCNLLSGEMDQKSSASSEEMRIQFREERTQLKKQQQQRQQQQKSVEESNSQTISSSTEQTTSNTAANGQDSTDSTSTAGPTRITNMTAAFLENHQLPLYPFILKLQFHVPKEQIFTSTMREYLESRADIITSLLSPIIDLNSVYHRLAENRLVQRMTDAFFPQHLDYYFAYEEGFLNIRRRYGYAMVQANISITEPIMEEIFTNSFIPASVHRLLFVTCPSFLGYDSIVNHFFLNMAQKIQSKDHGYLYVSYGKRTYNLGRYAKRHSNQSLFKRITQHGLFRFSQENLAPIAFYIMLYMAEGFLLRSSHAHIAQCLAVVEQMFHQQPSMPAFYLALKKIVALQFQYIFMHFPLITGLFYFIHQFIGDRQLSVLFLTSIWTAQCISSQYNRRGGDFAQLYSEFVNLAACLFLCYLRIYHATGLHYMAYVSYALVFLSITAYFSIFVPGFYSRRRLPVGAEAAFPMQLLEGMRALLLAQHQQLHGRMQNQNNAAATTATARNGAGPNRAPAQVVVRLGQGHNQNLNMNLYVGNETPVMNLRVEMEATDGVQIERGGAPEASQQASQPGESENVAAGGQDENN